MSDKPPRPVPPKSLVLPQRQKPGMPGQVGRSQNQFPNQLKDPLSDPNAQSPVNAGVRPPYWKRKYMVYPKFQVTLIVLNSLVTILMFGFVAFQVVRSHIYLENLVRSTRLPAQNLFNQMLSLQLRNLLINLLIALFISVIVTGITTLIMSHRVAGPMIRLKNFFTNVSKNGEFPEDIRFRKGDFFEDLPPMINQAFIALKKKWQK